MVSAVDDSVGTLLVQLDELNLSDDTVIIFFSDNGGLSTKPKMGPGSNSPLRAGKGWLYEGGVREPTIIRHRVSPKLEVYRISQLSRWISSLPCSNLQNFLFVQSFTQMAAAYCPN